ncbi:MAG: hypothetical protein WC375_08755 [Methanomassiliicoccales archaeon]|jgi:hypothetical protein
MAYLSKMNYKESRNSDGSIFSKGAEVEIMFGPDEVKFDLEKGFERDGLVLIARAFVAKGLQERGTVTAQIDVDLNKGEKKASAPEPTKCVRCGGPAPYSQSRTEPDGIVCLPCYDKQLKSKNPNVPPVTGTKEAAPVAKPAQAGAPPKIGKDQVDIILDVMKRSEKNRKIVDEYLGSVKAASIEDLMRPQGTKLIDRLYKGGVL